MTCSDDWTHISVRFAGPDCWAATAESIDGTFGTSGEAHGAAGSRGAGHVDPSGRAA